MTSSPAVTKASRGAPAARRTRAVSREHALIAELAAANLEGLHLARDLMAAQEVADDLERAAGVAIDHAASCPDDAEAADVAVATASAAGEAGDAELVASINWAGHVARVERLVDAARLCWEAGRR